MTITDNAAASTVNRSVARQESVAHAAQNRHRRRKARYNAAMQDTRSITVALVAACTTVVISMAALRAQQPPAPGAPANGTGQVQGNQTPGTPAQAPAGQGAAGQGGQGGRGGAAPEAAPPARPIVPASASSLGAKP